MKRPPDKRNMLSIPELIHAPGLPGSRHRSHRAPPLFPCLRRQCGRLDGRAGDLKGSARSHWVKACRRPRVLPVPAALDAVAVRHGMRPGEVTLALVRARPAVVAPITGATGLEPLGGLIRATRLRLSARDMATFDAAGAAEAP